MLRPKDSVRLLESDARLKTDDEWDLFQTQWWNDVDGQYEVCKTQDLAYRKPGSSPFGEKPRIFPPVSTKGCIMHVLKVLNYNVKYQCIKY